MPTIKELFPNKISLIFTRAIVIVGGDFNIILDEALDRLGGNKKRKESAKLVEEMCVEHDLIDSWCIHNPTETRSHGAKKNPFIKRGGEW